MATEEMYKELSDMIKCGICFEPMETRKPRMLHCLHVYCEVCLQQLIDNNPEHSGDISCPMCTQKTHIAGRSAASLPLFFYISQLVNISKRIERYPVCKVCKFDTDPSVISSYCFSCVCGHCKVCRVRHDKLYLNHQQISLSPSASSSIMCSKHDIHHTHFCMTCARAMCSQCYLNDHVEHTVHDLAYDAKNSNQDLKQFLLSSLKDAKEQMEKLLKLQAEIDENSKKVMEEMTHHRDYLLKQINDQYQTMCLELNKRQDDYKQLIKDTSDCIERISEQAESWLEPVKGVPEARILNSEQLMADIKGWIPSNELDIKPRTIKFVCGDDDVSLGKIIDDDGLSLNVKPKLAFQIETERWATKDIAYLDNSHLIVCMENGLRVYDDKGCEIHHYLSDFCKPGSEGWLWSISVGRNSDKIAVTQCNGSDRPGYLHVFMPNDDMWQYKRYEVCQEPRHVAVTDNGDFVICSYGLFDQVCKLYRYDSNGGTLCCVDMQCGSNVYDLFVSNMDMTLMCFSNEIVVYNKDGQQMSTLSTTDRNLEPRGVFVNRNGQIFICDERSKSILMVAKDHHVIRRLVELELCPKRLSLYNDNSLAVYGEDKISVYKL